MRPHLSLASACLVSLMLLLPGAALPADGAKSEAAKAETGNGSDVLTYGLGPAQQRHSPLTQVNRDNVADLVPVWNLSLDNSANMSTQPLVQDGVMYVVTHNATVAIDAVTGQQKWKTMVDLPEDVGSMICCGIHARGLAMRDGVIYRPTLDAHLQAMSAADGQVLWRAKVADYKQGYSMTGAPLLVGDVVMTGISGGEFNTRGFIRGYDARSGKELWTRFTTTSPGEPGFETWNGSDNWKTGGATTWVPGTYDPELDLVFWGTGNGAPWNPQTRAKGGDALYICSVLAIRPKTGESAWHYQVSPGDPYDYDSVNEMVLADLMVDGKPLKAVVNANRNGYFYVLERGTGKLVAANQYAKKLNWASGIDMQTGRPIETDMTRRFKAQEEMGADEEIWPSVFGAKNWQPISFDPKRQLAYVNGMNFGFKMKNIRQEPRLPAQFWGVEITGWAEPEDGNRGFLAAVDPLTGKHVWDVPVRVPHWSGVLSTAGDLVFTGNLLGEALAFDATNGKLLWKFRTGSGISGMPITWARDGKQYVTMTSGAATVYGAVGADPTLPAVPAGGSVWTFALHR